MKTYQTGEKVGYGVYLSFRSLDLRFVGADDESLEGRSGREYVRIPSVLLIALAPVIGGVFVMAFPMMVVAMSIFAIAVAMRQGASVVIRNASPLFEARWQPVAAYLNRRRSKKGTQPKPELTVNRTEHPELKDLEQEIADRRKQER